MLSDGQLATLAEHGEERCGRIGDVLFRVGDRRYPLISTIEGEAAVLDQTLLFEDSTPSDLVLGR